MTTLHIALWLLLAPACLWWLAGLPFVARTIRAVPVLARRPLLAPARWPTLSVIVPARNEGAHLEQAATSLLASDYPALQVVLVDDRSEDDTGAVVDRLAAADGRVVAVHVGELPRGWLGKNHALHTGLQHARGEWLLFTDADVHFAPDALRRAVAHAEEQGLDHLPLLPDICSEGLLLDAALAAFARGFFMNQRLWAVGDPDSSAFVGVGAFNLVRRVALERSAGLPWLALDVADDLALGKLMKSSGARCGVASGQGLVGLQWYHSLREMVLGLEKNTFAVLRFRLSVALLACLALLLVELSPWVAALPLGVPGLQPLGLGALLAQLVAAAVMCRWGRRRLLPALLVPLGTVLLLLILLRSAILGHRRGGIRWRETFYRSDELRAAARVRLP